MRISVDEGCDRLSRGEVVAIPTETVYGLAGRLENPRAIEQIYQLKHRPSNNPMIIHLAQREQLQNYVRDMPPGIEDLMNAFWPGPLTLVLSIEPATIPAIARAHLSTAAFRIPKHPMARSIAQRVGPLVAPSANLSGRPSATLPQHVEEDFGLNFPVVDAGACTQGIESTILVFQAKQWRIARLGALSAEQLQPVLGYLPFLIAPTPSENQQLLCPGLLHRHYAPASQLFLSEKSYAGEVPVVIGFSDRTYPNAKRILALGASTDVETVSHRLYAILRQLDHERIPAAWVDLNVPHNGLWKTIRERLTRAAEQEAE